MSQEFRFKDIDETKNYFLLKTSKIKWWKERTTKFVQL